MIQKPTISYKSSLALPERITNMDTITKNNLALTTIGGGLYHIKIEDATASLHKHYLDGETLYSVKHTDNYENLFVVGPEYGFGLFDINTTEEEVNFVARYDINETKTPLDVALQEEQYYFADYSGGVAVYDENLTFIKYLDVNASIKKVLAEPQSETSNKEVYALSSSGNGYSIQDGNMTEYGFFLPGSVNSVQVAPLDYSSVIYVSMLEKGLLAHNPYYEMDYYIDTFGINVSADRVNASWSRYNSIGFTVALNSDGLLNVFNGVADRYPPYVYNYNLEYDGVAYDQNISIYFSDDYLDSTTITKEQFTFKDETKQEYVEFSFSVGHDENDNFYAAIDPNKDLIVDNNYSLTVQTGVADMMGNFLEEPRTFTFTAVAAE